MPGANGAGAHGLARRAPPCGRHQKALIQGTRRSFGSQGCADRRNNRKVKAFEVERAREKAQVSLGSEGRPGLVARARP